MKTWIGKAIVAAAVYFGSVALDGPTAMVSQAQAAKATTQSEGSSTATDFSARRYHRRYYRYGYRPYYYARPYYYQPYPYYAPAPFMFGFGFGPGWW